MFNLLCTLFYLLAGYMCFFLTSIYNDEAEKADRLSLFAQLLISLLWPATSLTLIFITVKALLKNSK